MKVFLDSDVVISSLISSSGAAYSLIHDIKDIEKFVSNISIKELEVVVSRLNLSQTKLSNLISTKLEIVNLKKLPKLSEDLTLDPNDAHILAGAKKAKTKFLITYNVRHFKTEEIRRNLNIIVMTPARFLQYLRSLQ